MRIDSNYNREALPVAFNNNATASATNSLTIKPDIGVNASIRDSSSTPIIELNGADYVTLDGSNNGSTSRNLLVANNSTDNYTAVVFLSSPTAANAANSANGATNNVVKNLVVVGGTQNFYFNSRLVATVTYAGSGTLPGALAPGYFPGTNLPNPHPVLAHYQNSYFTLVPSGAGGAGYSYQLALSYDPAQLGTVAAANQLRQSQMQMRLAATSYHTDLTSTVSTAARTFSSGVPLTAFGTFTGSEGAAPLPVELVSFEAMRRGTELADGEREKQPGF